MIAISISESWLPDGPGFLSTSPARRICHELSQTLMNSGLKLSSMKIKELYFVVFLPLLSIFLNFLSLDENASELKSLVVW